MRDILEKTYRITLLYDFYDTLLTKKQREYFEFYYFDNYSLKEIADKADVSRSAISDQINRTVKLLEQYEENLKLLQKHKQRKLYYRKLKEITKDEKLLKVLKDLEKVE